MIDTLYRALRPALFLLDPETAHNAAVGTLRLLPVRAPPSGDPILATELWGRGFPNPIGLAAGFDKHAEAPDALLGLGFGHVEVGGVTPRPQPGNPRPRVFRLVEDRAVVNRYGLNSQGLDAVAARLEARRRRGCVGVNLGKNKDTSDAAADYEAGIARLSGLVDFLVVNLSSPNTPGLRNLQARAEMDGVIRRALAARQLAAADPTTRPPLLVKVAPDLDADGLADVAAVALETGIDGIIMGNTTLARSPDLKGADRAQAGGLSGRPLMEPSTRLLADLFRLTGGKIPLVGVGGIAGGADAYAKIRAGASLVQLYTALVFQGPALIPRMKRDLAALLRRDGFASVAEAVGADHR